MRDAEHSLGVFRVTSSSTLSGIMHGDDSGEGKLFGYKHEHGVGARSLHIIVALSQCAALPASLIAQRNGNIQVVAPVSCDDTHSLYQLSQSLMPQLVGHPNVASALLVAAGCEEVGARDFMPHSLSRNGALEFIVDGESNRRSITVLFGEAALSELSARSMPGFEYFTGSKVGILNGGTSHNLGAIQEQLNALGLEVVTRDVHGGIGPALTELALAGCIVIVNFLGPQDIPTGFPIVPVLNVSSGSHLHDRVSELIDLPAQSSTDEMVAAITATLGRQATKVELFGLNAFEPEQLMSGSSR